MKTSFHSDKPKKWLKCVFFMASPVKKLSNFSKLVIKRPT